MIKIIGLAPVAILAAYLLRRYTSRGLTDGRAAFMKDLNKRTLTRHDGEPRD